MDGTGIKFPGDGEWQTRKHGVEGRRQWRKLHLAMDPARSSRLQAPNKPEERRIIDPVCAAPP